MSNCCTLSTLCVRSRCWTTQSKRGIGETLKRMFHSLIEQKPFICKLFCKLVYPQTKTHTLTHSHKNATLHPRRNELSWHLSLHLRVFKCRAACGGICSPSVGLFMRRLLTEVITLALHRIVECLYSICIFLPHCLQF